MPPINFGAAALVRKPLARCDESASRQPLPCVPGPTFQVTLNPQARNNPSAISTPVTSHI